MTGWEFTINTGNPDADRATIEQYKRSAESQGMVLQVQPLQTGGFHLRAAPPQAGGYPQQPPAQYNPPQQGYGGAPQGYAPPPQQHGYGAPPAPQAYGPGQPSQAWSGSGGGVQTAWQPAGPAYAGAGGAVAAAAVAGVAAGVADLGKERIRYLRKVYSLLAVSAILAIVCGFVAITAGGTETFRVAGHAGAKVEVPVIVAAMLNNPGLMYGAFALLFVSTIGASFVSKVKGLNLVALLFVSALMGVELAPMAFVAQVFAGFGDTLSAHPVRDSFLLVGAIFVGITAYSFISRKDFSYLGATLTMGFFVVFVGCIIAGLLGSEVFSLAVASAGAVLSAGFILYNTSLMLRGPMDDAVGDALGLLVQLRNLFMFILRILMSSRN